MGPVQALVSQPVPASRIPRSHPITHHHAGRSPVAWDAEVFVHLVRIALPTSDLSSRARRDVSGDVGWLAQETSRREPRAHVVDLLVGEILHRLLPALDPETAATVQSRLPRDLAAAA